ncbi:acyl-CoA thioesterase [Streptomyces sp. NPDC088747]|uniref:acyl-CoA thioesterase n=1 Tax=Streptomyces sp. NPDC088747 TaxID=3365886 RepID=UPI00380777AE
METFTTRRRIRMSDADIYGNVHNLSIIQYAEDTAVEWVWTLRDELGIESYWGTANVQASFTMPLPWTLAEVGMSLQAEKVGRASLSLVTRITSDRGEHATVRARYIRFDSTGTRSTISPQEREWYARYLAPDARPAGRILAGVQG